MGLRRGPRDPSLDYFSQASFRLSFPSTIYPLKVLEGPLSHSSSCVQPRLVLSSFIGPQTIQRFYRIWWKTFTVTWKANCLRNALILQGFKRTFTTTVSQTPYVKVKVTKTYDSSSTMVILRLVPAHSPNDERPYSESRHSVEASSKAFFLHSTTSYLSISEYATWNTTKWPHIKRSRIYQEEESPSRYFLHTGDGDSCFSGCRGCF